MVEEQFVSFDTAKLLKETGFNETCRDSYDNVGGFRWFKIRETIPKGWVPCPTQALAARWLRETHDLHVIITGDAYVNGINYLWQVLKYNPSSVDCWDNESTGVYGDNGEYKTYEQAMEAGLRRAIKMIKK